MQKSEICTGPQTTVVLPICSIETCMHIISLCRSITNQTNLVSKIHFERDRICFFKQHDARIYLPPLKVKVQVYEYHRKIDPTMREKLCKPTLTMHILTYKFHQNEQDYFMLTLTEKHCISSHFIPQSSVKVNLKQVLFSVY